jgi:putative ABC transport system permease protein
VARLEVAVPLRATVRSLARARGLSAAVIVTLAIGAAALTTTFAIVHAALYRQPPFDDAHELALLYIVRDEDGGPRRERWSYARSELLRRTQRSFAHVARYAPATLTLAGEGDPETVRAERVSPGYFPALRVVAAHGRLFGEAEDDPGQPTPVALLGHALWMRRFGGEPSVIGRAVRLNGVLLTVIGIMPDGFRGLSGAAELWVPATMTSRLTYADFVTTNQNFISVVGRLRPGVTLARARSELAVLGADINRALPSDPERPDERVTATAISLNEARVDKTVKRSLLVLLGGVTLLHLLACANVTNLLLGRAAARRRESAVRMALGSSATKLFRSLFVEGAALALAGGVLGVLLAWWAVPFVSPPTNVWAPRNFYGSLAAFDVPAFGRAELMMGLTIAAATAAIVAIPPALTAFAIDVADGLRSGSRSVAGGAIRLGRPSARGLVVGVEAALAMLLVVAAGLLIDSFRRMRGADLGIDTSNVLTFWVIPSEVKVPPATAPAFVARLLDVVSRIPGVTSATVDGGAPVSGSASTVLYVVGREAPRQPPVVLRHYVAPDHFRTLGIRLLRGRSFTSADVAGAPRVTVISEGAARRFWPNEYPIGRRQLRQSGLERRDRGHRERRRVRTARPGAERCQLLHALHAVHLRLAHGLSADDARSALAGSGSATGITHDRSRPLDARRPDARASRERLLGATPLRRDPVRRIRRRGPAACGERHLRGARLRGRDADARVRDPHRPRGQAGRASGPRHS